MVDFLLSYNSTGLLQYRTLTETTLKYYPYLLEWSGILSDSELITERRFPAPVGVDVTAGAFNSHGLNGREGDDDRAESLLTLRNYILKVDRLVGFATSYMIETLEAEFMRGGYEDAVKRLKTLPTLCLMKYYASDDKPYRKLDDLYEDLCGSRIDGQSATDKLIKIKGIYEKWIELQNSQ
jgi:hypothetical protein